MGYHHSHTISFELGSVSVAAEVTYTVTPGQRPHYGSLSYAGDPGYPAEVDILSVELVHEVPENKILNRKARTTREPAGKLITDIIAADEDFYHELVEAAGETV